VHARRRCVQSLNAPFNPGISLAGQQLGLPLAQCSMEVTAVDIADSDATILFSLPALTEELRDALRAIGFSQGFSSAELTAQLQATSASTCLRSATIGALLPASWC